MNEARESVLRGLFVVDGESGSVCLRDALVAAVIGSEGPTRRLPPRSASRGGCVAGLGLRGADAARC